MQSYQAGHYEKMNIAEPSRSAVPPTDQRPALAQIDLQPLAPRRLEPDRRSRFGFELPQGVAPLRVQPSEGSD
jgi:hypothetical protein